MSIFTGISPTTTTESSSTAVSAFYQNQNTNAFIRLLPITLLIMLMFGSFTGSAQLLQWNTFGNLGTETTEPSVFNNANITSANLTQGTITPAANGNRFGGSGWFNTGNTLAGNTLAEAVAGNDYIQFIVTPNAGFSFTPTSLVFTWDRSGTGPSSVTLRSSADGFTANLGTVAGMSSGGASTTTPRTITITTLSNITAATTFRLYGYGATATSGTGGFDNASSVVDVQLNGTTASSSPPVVTPASPTGTVGTSFTYNIVASNSPISYAVSSGTLPAGLSLNTGTGAITGTATTAGSSSVDVTATNGAGPSSPATLSFTINPGNQTITGLLLTDTRTFGATPYNLNAIGGGSGNSVTFLSSNPAVADVVGNLVTIYGAGTTMITASQAGNANYNAAPNVIQTLNVNQATQTITFAALAPKPDNDPNFQLAATGGASGNPIVYTSSNTAVAIIVNNLGNPDPNGDWVDILAQGSTNIFASQAGNTNYLAATSVSQVQVVTSTSLTPQTITGLALTDTRTYGDAIYQLTATGGGSGNPVTYQSLNLAVATIVDNLGNLDPNGTYVKINSNGTATIRASQAGNGSYNPAPDVDQLLTVNQKEITVSGAVAGDKPYDGTNAATISGYTINGIVGTDNIAVTGGGTFADVNAGTWAVTAALILGGTDQTKYFFTQPTLANATINPAPQTITGLAATDTKTFGAAPYNLTATGGASGNPVTYAASPAGVVTFIGNQVTIIGGGVTTITASQAGNSNYNAAADVFQTLTVNQATQTITFAALANKTTADVPFSLTGTASSLLPVSYTSSNPAVADVVGNLVTIYGAGVTTITASQAGDANYLPANNILRTLIVTAPLIAAWDLTGPGNTATFAATTFNADLTSSNLITRGSTAGASAGANSFRTTGFKNEGISVANTDYFQTTLSAATGKLLSLSDITGRYNGTSSFFAAPGVTSQFAYSLDGTTFTLIGSPVTSSSLIMLPVDLTGISALQNVPSGTTVTIRYYASGQTLTGGWGFFSSAVGDNGLAFGGSIINVPCAVTGTATTTAVCTGNTDGTATVTLTGSGSGAPGNYSLDGGPATAYSTNPFTITGLSGGAHTVIATVTAGGCVSSSINANVTINPLPVVSFSGLAAAYCVNASSVTLTGSPAGGSFSGTGISGNSFDPATAGVGGPYTITYTYTDGITGCSNSSLQTVMVNVTPFVFFTGLAATYCTSDAAVTLTGNPSGGTFSGTGIVGNTFDPAVAGAGGPYTITYNYTDPGTGCSNNSTQQVTVTICTPTTITVNLKLFLQGYYAGAGTMQSVLNNQGVAALSTETDTLLVELHDATTFALIGSPQQTVLSTTGLASATFTEAAGSYYLAIKHRNTIQTWSTNPVACSFSTPLYDFSSAANQAMGDNQVEVELNVWAFFTGDLNQDDFVDGNDFPAFDTDSFNGVNSVYVATDMNGDGFVDGNDFPVFDVNSFNGVSSVHP